MNLAIYLNLEVSGVSNALDIVLDFPVIKHGI